MPLLEQNGFMPDLDVIPQDILNKAKIMFLNYPNNPTSAFATDEFFKKAIDFAFENNINLEDTNVCTICSKEYFSYRKNKTNERQFSFIWI